MRARGLVVAFLAAVLDLPAADCTEACARVRKEIEAQRTALAETRSAIHAERAQLRAGLLALERQCAETENEAESLEAREEAASRALDDALVRAANLTAELDRSFSMLTENRKELEAVLVRTGPTGDAFRELDELLDRDEPAGIEQRAGELLFALYRDHFATIGGIRRVTRSVVLPDGTKATGELLLCGGFLGVCTSRDRTVLGLVTLPPGAESYHVVSAGIPASRVREALTGGGDVLAMPIDVSGGLAVERLRQRRSLWEFLQAGGIVMIPLGLIAVLAIIMILERVVALRRADARIDPLLGRVIPLVDRGDFQTAASTLHAVDGPVGRVLLAGVEAAEQKGSRVEEVLEDAVLREVPHLERFTGTLGVFAAIAPLLGLLGTVSGMIETFQVITAYGTGNARLLSGGISEALITTEVGLVVAVPILLAHAWLSRRVRTMLGHLERASVSLAGALKAREGENGG